MPYLHWETDSRRAKMAEVVKEVTIELENKKPGVRRRTPKTKNPDEKTKSPFFDIWQDKTKDKTWKKKPR